MTYKDKIKEIMGEEFDVYFDDRTMEVTIGLRLTAQTRINVAILQNNPSHEILSLERNRILIEFKRNLTKLLWKYLGEQ